MDQRVRFPKEIVTSTVLTDRWPAVDRVALSGKKLAAAFEIVEMKVMPEFRRHSRLARIAEEHKNELVDFYNKVASDGRYLGELATHPKEVANKLNIEVSDDALLYLGALGSRLVEEIEAGRIIRTTVFVSDNDPELTEGSDVIITPDPTPVEIAVGVVAVAVVGIVVVGVGLTIKAEIDKHAPPHEQIVVDESGLIKIG